MKDFESFLMDRHASQYVGTDDMMVDDFADWVQDLDIEDIITYGDLYAKAYYKSKDSKLGICKNRLENKFCGLSKKFCPPKDEENCEGYKEQ